MFYSSSSCIQEPAQGWLRCTYIRIGGRVLSIILFSCFSGRVFKTEGVCFVPISCLLPHLIPSMTLYIGYFFDAWGLGHLCVVVFIVLNARWEGESGIYCIGFMMVMTETDGGLYIGINGMRH
ncbi:hypothetical protein BJY01DRAFT_115088 [Aspergillus pseudoustus]|uniref:Uncharacterized protein n=1 Tax=Aspergillus pseudoustus TaxID=1810923 RepID=A0ABR4KZR5_9EURO